METLRREAEISAGITSDRLRGFVKRWAPKDPQDCFDFQNELLRVMVDAMRHKTSISALSMSAISNQFWDERSLRPLRVIMENPKDGR